MVQYNLATGSEQVIECVDRGKSMMKVSVLAPDWIQQPGPVFVDDGASKTKQMDFLRKHELQFGIHCTASRCK